MFLIMLLLPAPLLARRGRWVPTDNLRRNCSRIVCVVTAFAVGHSITRALAAFGFVSALSRVVESMIALSILVSAYMPSGRSPEAARSGSPPASDSCTASPSPLSSALDLNPRGDHWSPSFSASTSASS
jgi:hypothetical protein